MRGNGSAEALNGVDHYEQSILVAGEMLKEFHEREAVEVLLPLLDQRQDDHRVYALLGEASLNLREFPEAIRALKIARMLEPNKFTTLTLANAYTNIGQLSRARKLLNGIRGDFIGTVDAPLWAWSMAEVVGIGGDSERCEQLLRYCIQEARSWATPWGSLGKLYVRNHLYAEALKAFEHQYILKPNWASAHDLGMHLPFAGRWEEAFERWREAAERKWHGTAFMGRPTWAGEAVDTLLILGDGGLGDTLQYARYLWEARRRCKRLVFCPQPRHLEIVRRMDLPQIDVEPMPPKDFDAGTWLMVLPGDVSLPDPKDSPPPVTYRYEPKPMPHPAVAITWAGDFKHANDKLRSTSIKDFAPIIKELPVHWFTVSPGPEVAKQIRASGLPIHQYEGTLLEACDYLATADAYLGVDTGHAHMTATIGRPTHVLLKDFVDSRWTATGEKTGYYPSMTLYRSYATGLEAFQAEALANLRRDLWAS